MTSFIFPLVVLRIRLTGSFVPAFATVNADLELTGDFSMR